MTVPSSPALGIPALRSPTSTPADWKIEPEFAPAYQSWKARPTPDTTAALLKATNPVLDKAVRAFAVGAAGPTLKGKAKRLAAESFQSYDPARGPLGTHLMSRLQRLRRLSAQEGQVIHVPEQVSMQRIAVDEAMRELGDKLGRDPTEPELADYTGISTKRLAYIRRAVKPLAEGYFDRDEGEDTMSAPQAARTLAAQDESWIDFIADDLNESDRFILDHAIGRGGKRKKSMGQIARQLGVSQGAISQRLKKIQAVIDQGQKYRLFN